MLLRLLLVFFLLFFSSVEMLYADVCYTQNLHTIEEVYQAQQCLKREIQKSINIARRYEKYTEDVISELKNYSELKAKCQKYDLLLNYLRLLENYSYSDDDLERKRDRYCKWAKIAKAKLRKVERRNGVLDNLYEKFKGQIILLKRQLELVELNYIRYKIGGR